MPNWYAANCYLFLQSVMILLKSSLFLGTMIYDVCTEHSLLRTLGLRCQKRRSVLVHFLWRFICLLWLLYRSKLSAARPVPLFKCFVLDTMIAKQLWIRIFQRVITMTRWFPAPAKFPAQCVRLSNDYWLKLRYTRPRACLLFTWVGYSHVQCQSWSSLLLSIRHSEISVRIHQKSCWCSWTEPRVYTGQKPWNRDFSLKNFRTPTAIAPSTACLTSHTHTTEGTDKTYGSSCESFIVIQTIIISILFNLGSQSLEFARKLTRWRSIACWKSLSLCVAYSFSRSRRFANSTDFSFFVCASCTLIRRSSWDCLRSRSATCIARRSSCDTEGMK